VLDGRWASPELMFWPAAAPQPRRYTLPVSYTSASAAYLVNTTYTRFDDARKQLRARLQGDMDATVKEFESLFRTGELEPVVAVGPATALIPLAVGGKLRSPTGVWDEVPVFERKLREATVSPTAHGRIFGLVSPGQIDDLFRSIDDPQFTQLRSDPRRTAYGDELMLMTTLLDVLADEAKASEFAFVFTNPHFGYLFSKVLPPPL
jgi:hypothetical protein